MTTATQDALNGPTYIVISRYPDGEVWIDETKLNATLEDAAYDIDNTHQVIMLEGGKAIDVSVEAAQMYWEKNKDKFDTFFDVPQFLHDHISHQVYGEISESRYNAHTWREQQMSCGPRL